MKEYVLIYTETVFSMLKKRVLLVLKDRPDWQKGFLNLPGGKVEPNETPEQAALRELKEETGYIGSHPLKLGELICGEELIHFYSISVNDLLQPRPIPREGETEIVRWFPWDLVKHDKRLIPNLRVSIPLAMSYVFDWKLKIPDKFINSEIGTIKITLNSNLNSSYTELSGVSDIIENGPLTF